MNIRLRLELVVIGRMLSIKVIYFMLFGGYGVLLPYLPVFYLDRGITPAYIGLLGAVRYNGTPSLLT